MNPRRGTRADNADIPSASDEPALVLLHHFGGSARTWQSFIDTVGGRRRCVALDLPGFGARAYHPGPYTVTAMADHVEAGIVELGLEDYVLVGHSMGGKVALALAARRPAGLRSLVLLAPSPPSAEPIDPQQRGTMLAAWGSRSAMSDIVDAATVRTLPAEVRATLVEDMLAVSRHAWQAWLLHGSREDITAAMAQIHVPALVASGDGDAAIPRAVLEAELLPRLANVELSVIVGAGHLLPIEAATETACMVRQCLGLFSPSDVEV